MLLRENKTNARLGRNHINIKKQQQQQKTSSGSNSYNLMHV